MNAGPPLSVNKAADAFRTISEVAEELDIPQHVLRFWETRFTSIKPLKRGGGRRYYRPDDVELLKGIRQLLYGQGYTIKGVQRILKEGGARTVQEVGRGGALPLQRQPEFEPAESEEAEYEAHGPAFLRSEPAMPPPQEMPRQSELAPRFPGMEPAPPMVHRAPAAPQAPVFGSSDLDRLRAALVELHECQRVLEGLRRKD